MSRSNRETAAAVNKVLLELVHRQAISGPCMAACARCYRETGDVNSVIGCMYADFNSEAYSLVEDAAEKIMALGADA